MTDTLVGRLLNPVEAWVDTKPRDDLDLSAFIEWLKTVSSEAAAEIERLTREATTFRETLRIERDCRLNETRQKDQYRSRALAAESSLKEAVKALEPFAKACDEPHCEALGLVTITVKLKDLRRASAIRARGAVLGSEEGSTHEA